MTGSPAPAQAAPAWPLHSGLELAALPTAPACARGHVRSVASEWGLADLSETAELLVSELVTNAVQASRHLTPRAGLPVIRLRITSDHDCIVIHVWDGNDEMPAHRDTGPDADSGRGLLLVEALGADWGAYREQNGKVVWVTIGPIRDP